MNNKSGPSHIKTKPTNALFIINNDDISPNNLGFIKLIRYSKNQKEGTYFLDLGYTSFLNQS